MSSILDIINDVNKGLDQVGVTQEDPGLGRIKEKLIPIEQMARQCLTALGTLSTTPRTKFNFLLRTTVSHTEGVLHKVFDVVEPTLLKTHSNLSNFSDLSTACSSQDVEMDIGDDTLDVLVADLEFALLCLSYASTCCPLEEKAELPLSPRPRSGLFIGRAAEMETICRAVKEGARVVNVYGPRGVGKRTMGLALCDRIGVGGIVRIDFEGSTTKTAQQAMVEIVVALEPTLKKVPASDAQLRALYNVALLSWRPFILLEDVTSADQIRLLVPTARASASSGMRDANNSSARRLICAMEEAILVVTSCDNLRLDDSGKGVVKTVELSPLAPSDAMSLVRAVALRLSEEEGTSLVRACNNMPLSLSVAGACLLKNPTTSASKIVASMDAGKGQPCYRVVGTALQYATTEVRDMALSLAVFPGWFDLQAAAAMDNHHQDLETIQAHLDELVGLKVIEKDDDRGQFRLHSIARRHVQDLAPQGTVPQQRALFIKHFAGFMGAVGPLYTGATYMGTDELVRLGLAAFDRDRHNIEAVLAWSREQPATIGETTAGQVMRDLFCRVAHAGRHVFKARFHPRVRIAIYTEALRRLKSSEKKETSPHTGCTVLMVNTVAGEWAGMAAELGRAHMELQEFSQASTWLEEAFVRYGTACDPCGQGWVLLDLGVVDGFQGKAQQSLARFEQSLPLLEAVEDNCGRGRCLLSIARYHVTRGETLVASKTFESALEALRLSGDKEAEADCLRYYGQLLNNAMDQYPRALEHLACARRLYEAEGDRLGVVRATNAIGAAHRNMSQVDKAKSIHGEALEMARAEGDLKGEGLSLLEIAVDLLKAGHPGEAVEIGGRTLKIFKSINYSTGCARVSNVLGNAYVQLGNVGQGVDVLEDAAKVLKRVGKRRESALCLGDLASAYYRSKNDVPSAVARCREGIVLAGASGSRKASGSLSILMDELSRQPIKSGSLVKQGKGESLFGRKSWKARHFVLTSSALTYFVDKKEKGHIYVCDMLGVTEDVDTGDGTCRDGLFGLRVKHSKGERVLVMQAKDREEAMDWMHHLRSVMQCTNGQGN